MDAYQRHFDDLSQDGRQRRDVSRLDELVALWLRLTGHGEADVERALREGAARRNPPEGRDWAEYARRAARYAFGVSGDRVLAGMTESRTMLLRIEGRLPATGLDTTQEQRR
jgi:hypothetical protein